MTEYARLTVRRTQLIRNRFYDTFEWQGEPRWPVIISYDVERDGMLKRFPWPLRKVEDRPWEGCAIYIRTDVYGGWLARLLVARHLLGQRLLWFYARLIMTAVVWECAYVPFGTIPSWRDLKWPWKKGKGQL